VGRDANVDRWSLRAPLRAEYGPSLGGLLEPRWRRASRRTRGLTLALAAAIAVVVVAAIVTTRPATVSVGGPVPFTFSYKGLHRVQPELGSSAKVVLSEGGRTEDTFAVAPLRLPVYAGSVTGEFPLYAASFIRRSLAGLYGDFELVGEGPIRTAAFGSWEELPPSTVYYHVPTYTIAFTAVQAGEPIVGRDVWLVPNTPGARQGVAITMLMAASAGRHPVSPLSLGTTGVLSRPMRTFSLGS
jgi:hypothetical protein